VYICNKGHESKTIPIQKLPVVTELRADWVASLSAKLGRTLTLGDYFSNPMLLSSKGKLPPQFSTEIQCSHHGCVASSSINSIAFLWPQILTIDWADTARGSQDLRYKQLSFDQSFRVVDSDGQAVLYTRIGRILHHSANSHFTAQLSLGDKFYAYDDMKGKLTHLKTANAINKRGEEEHCYVYQLVHAESTSSKVCSFVYATFTGCSCDIDNRISRHD
jgi:hypothetical protein